ncbi:MAG: hypothetical protein IPO64_14645 [Bacteroidetes bacterium]|nr:hypothetical protein [Bacteroidota bacterium]
MKFPKEGEYASFYRGYIEKAGQGDFFELLDINTQKTIDSFKISLLICIIIAMQKANGQLRNY